ncbi:MAG: hypothetical protein LKJ90_04775 [Faecalibacterium sp.]|jgi:hypothetical protein|nr:hypothetical protein [Faecalibacterium sp.]
MTLWETLLILLALLGFATLLVRRGGLSAGLAPLAALSLVLLVLLAAGMAGGLWPAALALVLAGWLALAASVAAFFRFRKNRGWLHEMFAPGSVLFWGGAVLLAARLAFLRPEFSAFDEYSFWGTAAKLMTLHDKLYTVCASGVPWQMTQLAAVPLASYFFQLFGDFAAWHAIFAADVLVLAGLAAVVCCAESAGRRVWAPLALVALALPTAFAATGHMSVLCTAWLEFLGDLPAGALFGGTVAFWLAVREKPGTARWLTLPVLCLAANIKSNTFVLALAAAGCIAVDAVCFAPRQAGQLAARPAQDKKGLRAKGNALRAVLGRIGFGAACFAAPAAQYLLWSAYTSGLVKANAAAGGLGDTANVTLPAVAYNGIKILLGGIGENYFEWHRQDLYDYRAAMRTAFFEKSVSIFGPGLAVCILIAAVFLLAAVLAPTVHEKVRTLVLAGCTAACFGGYWLMILFSYAFLMKDATVEGLVSYGRYFGSFYIGWLLLALAMLGRQAAAGRYHLLANGGALLLAAAAATLTFACFEPQFTILGVGRGQYAETRQEYAVAAQADAALPAGESVFLIYQGDQGQKWFTYEYALLPRILAYGAGGGTYGDPSLQGDTPYFQPYTRADFAALVAKSGAQYLLIVQSDDTFAQSYGALFTDGLAAAQQGKPVLYTVTAEGYAPYQTLETEAAA